MRAVKPITSFDNYKAGQKFLWVSDNNVINTVVLTHKDETGLSRPLAYFVYEEKSPDVICFWEHDLKEDKLFPID